MCSILDAAGSHIQLFRLPEAWFSQRTPRLFAGSLNLETSNHVYILQNWLYRRASVLRTPAGDVG
ncbi:hypothetical protein EIKCOROL_02483 [Eikenella corrodens ATCC 23834]|uniref:Uncharacterized protein n=1 Tax=Eikenella corrodens ATCC 23834 TaxID=546274 RepID=C0DYL7_EIKCO|nr:hypothetical protein EIKCOROL_02483 [Eikenella corrodens ATCC 23834]